MTGPPRLALLMVRAAARLAPAEARAALRGEWQAELWHRAHLLRREGRWGAAPAAALVLRSCGALADALDLRFCGPDGAADPWVEAARTARFAGALLCAGCAVAAGALAVAAASTLPGSAGPFSRGGAEGGARTFILAVGALWSVGVVAASARASCHLLGRRAGAAVRGAGVFGLALGVAVARYAAGAAPSGSVLATSALWARTAVACMVLWGVAALVLHAWRTPGGAPRTR